MKWKTIFAIIFLLISGWNRLSFATMNPDPQELGILFSRARVQQIGKDLRETKNPEEMARALHELKQIGDEAMEEGEYSLLASAIAAFRFGLDKREFPEMQVQAERLLLELNEKLFPLLQQHSSQELKELTPLFVVLDPVVNHLKHSDGTISRMALENLTLLNQMLSLFQNSEELAALLSPYLMAARVKA